MRIQPIPYSIKGALLLLIIFQPALWIRTDIVLAFPVLSAIWYTLVIGLGYSFVFDFVFYYPGGPQLIAEGNTFLVGTLCILSFYIILGAILGSLYGKWIDKHKHPNHGDRAR